MMAQALGALSRRASLLTPGTAGAADARKHKNRNRNKNKNEARKRCRRQVGQCNASTVELCRGDAACLARAQACCLILGTCDATGFFTCLS
jgi:hypothetical protein